LKYNNLGGMGPQFKDPPQIYYTKVGQVDGRWLDLIITSVGTNYKSANWNYKGMTGRNFIKRWNGVHSTPGAGVVGSMAPGKFEMTFTIVDSETKKETAIPYLPITFYDVDGGKETTETCDAESAVVHKPTGIKGGCSGSCCRHQGTPKELGLPNNWDKLSTEVKMGSVSYLFQDKSKFNFKYEIGSRYEHRIFLFKGSKALACTEAR